MYNKQLFLFLMLFTCAHTHTMMNLCDFTNPQAKSPYAKQRAIEIQKDIWIHIFASCTNMATLNQLSKTCTFFLNLIQENRNNIVSPHSNLHQDALNKLMLFKGKQRDQKAVRTLLAKGANPNARDEDGLTLLHHVARTNDCDMAVILLNHPALTVAAVRCGQESPYAYAIRFGNRSIMHMMDRFILEKAKTSRTTNSNNDDVFNEFFSDRIIHNESLYIAPKTQPKENCLIQ